MTPDARAVLGRVVHLEMWLLPMLKGDAEKHVQALIWAAHDVLKRDAELRRSDVARQACAVAEMVIEALGPLRPEKRARKFRKAGG